MTGPTAQDYLWAADEYLGEYCVTVVPGLAPEEVLRRWSADRLGTVDCEELLGELALDAWAEHRGPTSWRRALDTPSPHLGQVLTARSAGARRRR